MNHRDPVPINVKHAHVLTSMFLGLVRARASRAHITGSYCGGTAHDRDVRSAASWFRSSSGAGA